MRRLGRNADGEVLESGRVPDCYLGLVHHASDDEEDGVLVVAPAALLHPSVPQPDGIVLYELGPVTPTGCRTNWCLCPDLAVELRAWPYGTWARLGVDPQTAVGAVIAAWRGGHVKGPSAWRGDRRGGAGAGAPS